MNNQCPICDRITPDCYMEKHHLIPKCRKGKITELMCCDCHDMIHQLFTEKELERKYFTIESILAVSDIQKWIKWIQKKPDHFRITMKRKKKR